MRIWGLLPHTHLRGTRWQYQLVLPDSSKRIVLDVPYYDFNWQTYYMFAKPLEICYETVPMQSLVEKVAEELRETVPGSRVEVAGTFHELPGDEALFSVGGGLRWRTIIGPVRLEYGHNLNPRPRDPSGTLQFSLGFPF